MRINSSVIDFPRKELDPSLWQEREGEISLLPEIEDQVKSTVDSFLDAAGIVDPGALKGLFIYGSILTNQWNPGTDVDGRILLDKDWMEEQLPGITGDDLFDEFYTDIHGILLGDTKHPLNLSVVIEGEMPELGQEEYDPVYDVLNKKLIKNIYEEEFYDPYELFEEDLDEVHQIAQTLDKLLFETKSDVIDYQVLQDAVSEVEEHDRLIESIDEKVQQIESDLQAVVDEFEDIHDKREEAFSEDPAEDWRRSKHWGPGNVQYKFLERYKYIDMLKKLKRIFKDGLEEEEIDDVAEVLDVDE